MWLLRDYAINIIVVSVLAILLELILPQTPQKKYVHVVIGLVVMMVIIAPLTKLPHYKDSFSIPYLRLDDYDLSTADVGNPVAREFEKRLALKINEAVYGRFGTLIKTEITASVSEEGEVVDISRVTVSPASGEITEFISETFGIGKDKFEEGV